MKNTLRLATVTVAAAVGLMMLTPTAAHASKKGRRNTAIALGAVAAYGLVKKKPAIAGIAGAGAVYSWIRSNQVEDDRDRNRQRARQQNRGYNSRYAGDRYYDNGYRGSRYSNNGYNGNGYYSRGSRGRSYSQASRYDNGRRSSGRSSRGRRCN